MKVDIKMDCYTGSKSTAVPERHDQGALLYLLYILRKH